MLTTTSTKKILQDLDYMAAGIAIGEDVQLARLGMMIHYSELLAATTYSSNREGIREVSFFESQGGKELIQDSLLDMTELILTNPNTFEAVILYCYDYDLQKICSHAFFVEY